MPGLPFIPYDRGIDCPACPELADITPLRMKMKFSGIRESTGGTLLPDKTVIVPQHQSLPCRYDNDYPTDPDLITFQLSQGSPSPTNTYILRMFHGLFFTFIFENPPRCLIRGTFDNDLTESMGQYGYGGTCTISPA